MNDVIAIPRLLRDLRKFSSSQTPTSYNGVKPGHVYRSYPINYSKKLAVSTKCLLLSNGKANFERTQLQSWEPPLQMAPGPRGKSKTGVV